MVRSVSSVFLQSFSALNELLAVMDLQDKLQLEQSERQRKWVEDQQQVRAQAQSVGWGGATVDSSQTSESSEELEAITERRERTVLLDTEAIVVEVGGDNAVKPQSDIAAAIPIPTPAPAPADGVATEAAVSAVGAVVVTGDSAKSIPLKSLDELLSDIDDDDDDDDDTTAGAASNSSTVVNKGGEKIEGEPPVETTKVDDNVEAWTSSSSSSKSSSSTTSSSSWESDDDLDLEPMTGQEEWEQQEEVEWDPTLFGEPDEFSALLSGAVDLQLEARPSAGTGTGAAAAQASGAAGESVWPAGRLANKVRPCSGGSFPQYLVQRARESNGLRWTQ